MTIPDPLTVLLSAIDAGGAAHVEVTVVRDGQTATYAQTYPAGAVLPTDSRARVGVGMETPAESGAEIERANDPLDENDRRDRIDGYGVRWVWTPSGWRTPTARSAHCADPAEIRRWFGPLRFADEEDPR